MRLDSVQLSVADVAEATRAYTLLLGVEPLARPCGVQRFQLAPGAVEIEPGDRGLRAVRFVAEPGEMADWPPPELLEGLHAELVADPGVPRPIRLPAVQAIDHVVVRTPDPDRAVALWRDRIGLRLAFDRTFPSRGLRLLFFRSGGVTFEFAASHPPAEDRGGPDLLWGVSYRVVELDAHRARLLAAGLDVSAVRPGHKPGTRVVSVRSGTCNIPTLLLEEP
jgi:catechol 2,3-dioxygenase-like lactoylglutathione lyase family enzyme